MFATAYANRTRSYTSADRRVFLFSATSSAAAPSPRSSERDTNLHLHSQPVGAGVHHRPGLAVGFSGPPRSNFKTQFHSGRVVNPPPTKTAA